MPPIIRSNPPGPVVPAPSAEGCRPALTGLAPVAAWGAAALGAAVFFFLRGGVEPWPLEFPPPVFGVAGALPGPAGVAGTVAMRRAAFSCANECASCTATCVPAGGGWGRAAPRRVRERRVGLGVRRQSTPMACGRLAPSSPCPCSARPRRR